MHLRQAVQLQSISAVMSVIAYRKWDFKLADVSSTLLRYGPLKRETSGWAGKENTDWWISKQLYGLSTACKDWGGTIRDSLDGAFVGEVTSMGKSVYSWTQQRFGYGYGEKFRDPNNTHLEKGILKAHGNFETGWKRNVSRIISIHVGGLFISGGSDFVEYISWKM